jgi:hypothetical protein
MGATAARPGSECWAPRGGKASPDECGARSGGRGPALVAYGGGTAADDRAPRRRGARTRSGTADCGAASFDQVLLPKFELKGTKE